MLTGSIFIPWRQWRRTILQRKGKKVTTLRVFYKIAVLLPDYSKNIRWDLGNGHVTFDGQLFLLHPPLLTFYPPTHLPKEFLVGAVSFVSFSIV